ncbi:MAG: phage portal protein, partial [Candidatus Rokuibacteriota bacterium]
MSLARGLAGTRLQERASAEEPEDLWLKDAFLGGRTFTGKTVTVESALAFDAVVACVRLLSESCGAFPLKVYERTADDRKRPLPAHNTYRLLHDRPNWEQPPVTVWGLVMTHLVTWGDSFLGKTFDAKTGAVIALWPIKPDRVRVERKNGHKIYWVRSEHGVQEKSHDARTVI